MLLNVRISHELFGIICEALPFRFEAIAIRLEAIAIWLEALPLTSFSLVHWFRVESNGPRSPRPLGRTNQI